MAARPKILSLASDPVLNRTRRLILQRFFEVRLAAGLEEAASLLREQSFDLLVLCYSVDTDEARVLVELIRSLGLETKILALEPGTPRFRLPRPHDECFPNGPAELLRKVARMTGIDIPEAALPETGAFPEPRKAPPAVE